MAINPATKNILCVRYSENHNTLISFTKWHKTCIDFSSRLFFNVTLDAPFCVNSSFSWEFTMNKMSHTKQDLWIFAHIGIGLGAKGGMFDAPRRYGV